MAVSPKYWEKSPMYEACATLSRSGDVQEASDLMQALWTRGTQGTRINAAQRILCARPFDWTRNRVVELFSGKASRVDTFETRTLAWLRAKQLREAKEEYAKLTALIEGMEESLSRIDADFHSHSIDALRQSRGVAAATLGDVDSSRTDGAGE